MENRKLSPLLAIALALPLMGCGQLLDNHITFATWKQQAPNAAPQVTVKPARFDVTFNGEDSGIDQGNESAMNEFLAANRIGTGNSVELAIGPVREGDGNLAVRRVNAVEGALQRRGIAVQSIQGLPDAQPGAVSILAKLVNVTPPGCPGYSAPIHIDTEGQPVISPGCSNESNLDLMVANPADLAGGRPLPPGDAEGLALGVQRYHEGKVPPLTAPLTTSSQ
jgi:pilus biogenesis lipoprotein CpaD